MAKKYKCPFCDVELKKRDMQFHVGVPLCMKLREEKAKTELSYSPHKAFQIPIPKLDMEYYGQVGIEKLLTYMFERATFGHPDAGKPVDLANFVDHTDMDEYLKKEEEIRQKEEELWNTMRSAAGEVIAIMRKVKEESKKESDTEKTK